MLPFVDDAIELLRLEPFVLTDLSSTPELCPDEKRERLRINLFGSARHFGGTFKPLIDAVDRFL